MNRPDATGRRHALERRLAPHVAAAWSEAFVLELRLAGVPGPRIVDALLEVDSHCAESGQSAADGFGEPATYARSLGLASTETPPRETALNVGPTIVQIAGMLLRGARTVQRARRRSGRTDRSARRRHLGDDRVARRPEH